MRPCVADEFVHVRHDLGANAGGVHATEAEHDRIICRQGSPPNRARPGCRRPCITLSEDGNSFTSKFTYEQFDVAGKPAEGGGEATGQSVKLTF